MLGIAASIRGGAGIGRGLSFATRKRGVVLGNFARHASTASLELRTDNDFVRFSITKDGYAAKEKKSKNKAKKKMNSPNPEVRIRYKLEKAKRKEAWLIEKLRKFEVSKTPGEVYDPEILTKEEKHYLKRTGEKKKNYVPVGQRGFFGGVVLNMHLHWKKHETVKGKELCATKNHVPSRYSI
ncbi:hypothetical protein OIU76_016400 [Salix suchowensis]|nr:hypothetical protein OIU76_016400 [Salix suchowensis]